MFTIKLYSEDGHRCIIKSAESFTILRGDYGEAEITIHQKNQSDDFRVDIARDEKPCYPAGTPPKFGKAIIENAAGRTTDIIALQPVPFVVGHSESNAIGGGGLGSLQGFQYLAQGKAASSLDLGRAP